MPIVIPTPDEISRMGARERAAWRRRMGAAMCEVQQARTLLTFGDVVRSQAHLWERIYGPDPEWEAHQAALMEAIA